MNSKFLTGNKSNTGQAFWVATGSFSSFALSIISAAILSRYLSKTEYGSYRQVIYVYNTLLVVFTAGLPRVFSYFLPRYNLSEGKEIVIKISRVLLFTGLAFSIFLFICSDLIAVILKNPELSRGLKFFSPVPLLLMPTLGIEGIFSTYKKTIYIALYQIITRMLMLLLIVLPVIIFSRSYLNAIYGWILGSMIILVIAYFFKGIPFRGVSLEKSGLGFKEILSYSLPLVSASIAGTIYRSANQFYISRYFGPEVFAEFSNGFIIIPFVSMITGATSTVLMPAFARIIHEKGDVSKITTLWQNALGKSAILIYPIVIYFLFYSEEVVTIVYSEAYTASSVYFSIAMVLSFFNIIVFTPLLLALGESKFYARMHYGLAITTWLVQYIVIILFDSPAVVAISYVIIAICGLFIAIWYVAKKLKVTFFSLFPVSRLFIIAMHSFISLLIVDLLFRIILPEVIDILFLTIVGAAFLCVLLISAKLVKINYLEIIKPLLYGRNDGK
ncbi:MAG: oligosaccharide flippase family protein [Bacteroidota bacterium]